MALKSYRLFSKGKKKKRTPLKDIATAGVTAFVALPLITETASVIRRI